MMQFIKKLDHFGVSFSPMIGNKQESQFQSYIGGFSTILLYTLSFFYFIFTFQKWQSNKMLPKVLATQEQQQYNEFSFQDNPFRLTLDQRGFDAFDQKNNILTPVLISHFSNGTQSNSTLFEKVYINNFNQSVLEVDSLSLTLNNSNNQSLSTKYYILLVICEPSLMKFDQKCASQNTTALYFSKFTNVKLQMNINKYENTNKQLISCRKEFQFVLEQEVTFYSQIFISTGKLKVQDGFLFNSERELQYLNSIETVGQTINQQKLSSILSGMKVTTAFYIQLDPLSQYTVVSYPLLGQVLAEVGSIVSILLLAKSVVELINRNSLQQYLVDEIIGFYYPQYRNLFITRNFNDKIIKLQSKDLQTEYNHHIFQSFYTEISEMAQQKLNILNILQEIQRIQFILQSLQSRQQIALVKQIGIELPLQQIKIFQGTSQIHPFQEENNDDNSIQTAEQELIIKKNLKLNKNDMQFLCSTNLDLTIEDLEQIDQEQAINLFYKINNEKNFFIKPT